MSKLEQKETKKIERAKVSYAESLTLAEELLEKHEAEIRAQIGEDIEGTGEDVFTDFFNSIEYFLDSIPEEIKSQYYGHGIVRGNSTEKLAAALNIAANKAIMGWQGRVSRTGGYDMYTDGGFIVISHFGKQLAKPREQIESVEIIGEKFGKGKIMGSNEEGIRIAWIADIGAIVVNSEYYSLIDDMKKMYPDVNIIKANELPDFMNEKK